MSRRRKVKSNLKNLNIPDSELYLLIEEFNKGDVNGDGTLNEEEFVSMMNGAKVKDEMRDMFKVFDSNGDGTIEFSEFVASISILRKGTLEEKLKLLFQVYDRDKSGTLTKDELTKLLHHLSKAANTMLENIDEEGTETADRFATTIINKLDFNKDGNISLEEWLKVGPRTPALTSLLLP